MPYLNVRISAPMNKAVNYELVTHPDRIMQWRVQFCVRDVNLYVASAKQRVDHIIVVLADGDL